MERIPEPEVMSDAEEVEDYDAMDFSETDRTFVSRALELADDCRTLLDLGSGPGTIPLSIVQRMPFEASICLTDMSLAMLRASSKKFVNIDSCRIRILAADACRLPFADASVDMILSNSTVHHIPDPLLLFREIRRVLRPGSPLLIRDLFRPSDHGGVDALVDKYALGWNARQSKLFRDSLHAALTPEEVRELLDQTGLHDVDLSVVTDRHWSAERSRSYR